MTRELWLLRHGKSVQDFEMEDFDRPLSKRGKLAALRIGQWLKQEQLIPDYIVSSPAARAIATARKVHAGMAVSDLNIHRDKRLYMQGINAIKTLLAEIPEQSSRVLLVGHNPDLESLLGFLIGSQNLPLVDKILPTATAARLAMPADWSQLPSKCATLLSITCAKTLALENGN